ncbi:MAG: MJ1477/TM1410 family putative glycoside hydrolase [Anaerolineae bacterium]
MNMKWWLTTVVCIIALLILSLGLLLTSRTSANPGSADARTASRVYLPFVRCFRSDPDPILTPVPDDKASWPTVTTWVYQLTGYDNDRLDEIASSDFDLAVVDLARDGSEGFFTRDEIAAVQATGKIVVAYFEIGAIEDYRPEWPDVPDDLKLGPVSGWPSEQYVSYWDERWWPVVAGRVDQAIAAGFDGAYLDMVLTYEEIPADAAGTDRDDLAQEMVDLIARLSAYAKAQDPDFKVMPQNAPELYTYPGYLDAIDGLGIEELYFIAMDRPCSYDWCAENRANAAAVAAADKLVLTVDYANQQSNVDSAYTQSLAAGFVPYVSERELDAVRLNLGWAP